MTGRTRRILIVLGIMAIGAWILGGCGGSSNGTGRIQVSLSDAPLDDAAEVNIYITSVDVHSESEGWKTLKTWEDPIKVNLLDYRGENPPLLLVDAPLGVGKYTQIRLMLDSATIVWNAGDDPLPVDLTNVEQTGVKCIGPIDVEEGQICAIILDFNAGRAFVEDPPGSNNFKLHPTMTMSPVNIATEVIGKVVVKDAQDVTQPIPADAVIYVYAGGHIGEDAFLLGSADIDALESDPLIAAFSIAVLPQGTYDFRIVFNGTGVKDITGQAISPPETDLGTITVTLQ